jgi:hypothetical protein
MPRPTIERVSGHFDSVVSAIQDDFLKHPDFVYFRKGEFQNAVDVAAAYLTLLGVGVGVKLGVEATVGGMRSALGAWRTQGKLPPASFSSRDLRFMMCDAIAAPDALAGADALRELGFDSRQLPGGSAGTMRYFVSATEFFLFFISDRQVEGTRGTDATTRSFLQALFLEEWRRTEQPS